MDWKADRLVFNAHRVYGPLRLALATANFEVLGVFGTDFRLKLCGPLAPGLSKGEAGRRRPACAQPLLVLRKVAKKS